jgi:hypothetical protein
MTLFFIVSVFRLAAKSACKTVEFFDPTTNRTSWLDVATDEFVLSYETLIPGRHYAADGYHVDGTRKLKTTEAAATSTSAAVNKEIQAASADVSQAVKVCLPDALSVRPVHPV